MNTKWLLVRLRSEDNRTFDTLAEALWAQTLCHPDEPTGICRVSKPIAFDVLSGDLEICFTEDEKDGPYRLTITGDRPQ